MGKPYQYGRNFDYKFSHFGTDTNGHDVKAFGNTTGKYVFWDASADTLYVVGTLSQTGNQTLIGTFTVGVDDTGHDVKFFGATTGKYWLWDESADKMIVLGAFDITGNSQFTGEVTVGVNDTGHDVKFFGATTGKYFLWDESADKLIILGDYAITGNSVFTGTAQFTGALTVGVDGTSHDVKFFGDTAGKYLLWDESADALIVNGIIQIGATITAALALGGGTSATKLTTATADKNFIGFWTESTATSGDSRGAYIRHYLGGTIASTGYGDAIRAFCTVTGTGYSYASGIHATMQINAAATVTGSGAAVRATLAAAAESRTLSGALAALQLDSDIGANNTMPTVHGFIRATNSGTVALSNLAVIPNASNGTMFAIHTTQVMSHSIKIISENGTAYYIMCTDAATNRS